MKQVLKTNEWKAGLDVTKWLEPLNVSRHFFFKYCMLIRWILYFLLVAMK